jgi:hypothetical protein
MWEWNLVTHFKLNTQVEGVLEQVPEQNILTLEKESQQKDRKYCDVYTHC